VCLRPSFERKRFAFHARNCPSNELDGRRERASRNEREDKEAKHGFGVVLKGSDDGEGTMLQMTVKAQQNDRARAHQTETREKG
jgi:hypothetical protein